MSTRIIEAETLSPASPLAACNTVQLFLETDLLPTQSHCGEI
jgi:hypothetical protein